MMDRAAILAKPSWQLLLKRNPTAFSMSSSLLLAADSFFDFVGEFGLSQPQADDLLAWAKRYDQGTQNLSLTQLREALSICAPTAVAIAEQAIRKLAEGSASKEARTEPLTNPASNSLDPWDPIAPSGPAPVARRVSIAPQDLPERWQQGLRDAANGLIRGGPAPADSILMRMREKLCQFVWSAREHGLNVRFTPESIALYEQDVRDRSELGEFGLRWATVRASIEELLRFARYVGESEAVLADLRTRLRAVSSLENSQLAIKYFEIARTGNTTDRILDRAEQLLHDAPSGPTPKKRHQMRNGASILAIFSTIPLRNASADLVFGVTLFWRETRWVIETKIQKTHTGRPQVLRAPLEPEAGKFIDAILIGDASPRLLPELRSQALREMRQLFVLPNGQPTAKTYIPRVFKALTDNSLTTARSMLHTDCAVHHGAAGVEMAKSTCHQRGEKIHLKYQLEHVARAGVDHCRESSRARRLRYLDEDPLV